MWLWGRGCTDLTGQPFNIWLDMGKQKHNRTFRRISFFFDTNQTRLKEKCRLNLRTLVEGLTARWRHKTFSREIN